MCNIVSYFSDSEINLGPSVGSIWFVLCLRVCMFFESSISPLISRRAATGAEKHIQSVLHRWGLVFEDILSRVAFHNI